MWVVVEGSRFVLQMVGTTTCILSVVVLLVVRHAISLPVGLIWRCAPCLALCD